MNQPVLTEGTASPLGGTGTPATRLSRSRNAPSAKNVLLKSHRAMLLVALLPFHDELEGGHLDGFPLSRAACRCTYILQPVWWSYGSGDVA